MEPLVTTLHEHEGKVWIIGINRAKARNAVDRSTAEALTSAFQAFEEDPRAKVAILTGNGGTFCAGADLKAVSQGEPEKYNEFDSPKVSHGPMGPTRMVSAAAMSRNRGSYSFAVRSQSLTKPVIAAIEGFAVAGGLELALWADLRVASEDAKLGVFCRRWGVPLIDGGTVRLVIGLVKSCCCGGDRPHAISIVVTAASNCWSWESNGLNL